MYRLDATDESKAARQWSGIVSGQDPVVARLDDHNIEHADQLKALIRYCKNHLNNFISASLHNTPAPTHHA
jgi:hypothetical protein